jgi:hypothetical protein
MTKSGLTFRSALAAALVIAGLQVITQQQASACTRNGQGVVVGVICLDQANGGTPGGGDADPDWHVIRNSGVYCSYNGIDSYIGDIQNNSTGEIIRDHCVAQNAGSAGTNLRGIVRQSLKAPTPDPDFKAEFLVGAPIKFSSAALKNYTLDVPNFPDVQLVVTATDVKWDFGDGTTSTDLEPVHVYESISPNKQNADQHKVRVTLQASWQANLLNSTTGTSQDLGIFTDQGELDRSIVQVWSKQTEPNS